MSKLLIIDSPALCYRIKFGMEKVVLTYEESKVEVIFGFLKQILDLAFRFRTDKFVFAWDSRKSKRKKIFPTYKYKRKEDKTEEQIETDKLAYKQFNRIRSEVLPALGFVNNFIQTGLEADDIIASVVCLSNKCENMIVSRDNDLYQLISRYTSMYDYQTRKIIDKDSFFHKYLIPPQVWREVKKIAGCATDNVPGVPGVKEKTAIKYILGELPEHYKTYKAILSKEGQKTIKRNKLLVCLPFEGTKEFPIIKNKLYSKDFYDTFEKLGFKSFLSQKNFREWEIAFNLC